SYMSEESCIQKSRVGGFPNPPAIFFLFFPPQPLSAPPKTQKKKLIYQFAKIIKPVFILKK
ncbi:hypothetical protein ACVGX7_04785, partial [Enterobacter hormaechei]